MHTYKPSCLQYLGEAEAGDLQVQNWFGQHADTWSQKAKNKIKNNQQEKAD